MFVGFAKHRWIMTMFSVVLFSFVFPSTWSFAASQYFEIHTDVMNAIESVAGGQDRVALINISAAENSGSSVPRKHKNANGTHDWGVMQINDVNLSFCGVTGEQLMTSGPELSVQCAYKIYVRDSASCSTFEAKLCSYNRGRGWCVGSTKYNLPARPSEPCAYSDTACRKTGTDCVAATIMTNPYTGFPNVQRTTDLGNEGEPLNCQDLKLSQDMAEAAKNYIGVANLAARDAGEQARANDYMNPSKFIHGNSEENYCISIYYDVMGFLRMIKAGANLVEAAILGVLKALAQYACEVVVDALNNVLNALCVPMPELDFGLDLDVIKTKSCSGLSLGDIVKGRPGIPLKIWEPEEAYKYLMQGIKDPNTGEIKY